uniref:Uncharacterized protein n=1 Tax=Rhizophora mucronata TaxID=61149 RepID=A0A2P2MLG6_RHIMU
MLFLQLNAALEHIFLFRKLYG